MKERIALGTVQFGLEYGISNSSGKVPEHQVHKILQIAIQNGLDTLDTAIAYGESEHVLGKTGIADWKVVTKLPDIPIDCDDVSSWVNHHVEGSLSRLRVPRLHAILLHEPAQLLAKNGQEFFSALINCREKGLVSKIGYSIYNPEEIDELIYQFPPDIIQAPFNILDRRIEKSGWLKKLKTAGVEIHTRSAFLQGLLLMPRERRPKKFSPWDSIWNEWHNWLEISQVSALQASLAFVLSHKEIDRLVIGVESDEQLKEILSSLSTKALSFSDSLSSSDIKLINPSQWQQL